MNASITSKGRNTENSAENCGEQKAESTAANETAVADNINSTPDRKDKVLFPVTSVPSWPLICLYAIQQVMSALSGPVSAAFIIRSMVCADDDKMFLAQLISTTVFMNGVCTLLQVTLGVRLPIIQGSCFNYLAIMASMMATPQWKCPRNNFQSAQNDTTLSANVSEDKSLIWKARMLEASGALVAASAVQVLLGCLGLVGFMMRFIGPLTIAPTIMFVGLSLTNAIVTTSQHSWAVASFTVVSFLVVYSFLGHIDVPFVTWNMSQGCHTQRYPLFRLFPQAIAIILGWILCGILTSTAFLPDSPDLIGYRARTDTNVQLIVETNWFFFPYPGMWGTPTISVATFFGMLAATICSIIESIGDYYGTARACNISPPPKHAMNRGIAMEGFGSIICGLLGSGHATTSYSSTIGFISLTGMASRRTWQVAGFMFIIAGICGKFAAVLACIPDPVIGGLLIIALGMVVSVGLATLQFTDLSSSRNHIVLGISILLGVVVPTWIQNTQKAIDTGNENVDQILTVLLSTAIFVGGGLAFTLDNLLPGTQDERGFTQFNHQGDPISYEGAPTEDVYNLPSVPCIDKLFKRHGISEGAASVRCKLLTYVPFLPCYINPSSNGCCSCRHRSTHEICQPNNNDVDHTVKITSI